MRQHTAFRVGRTTRCGRLSDGVVRNHDIPRLNSRVTIIRIQRDKGRATPRRGFRAMAGQGRQRRYAGRWRSSRSPGNRYGSPARALASQGRPRAIGPAGGPPAGRPERPGGRPAGGGRAGVACVAALSWAGACPAVAAGGESEAGGAGAGPGNRTPAGAPGPRGYASLCWPASDPAVRSRAVWGRQGDWLSGRALRSHRRGRWFEPSIAHESRRARKVLAHLTGSD